MHKLRINKDKELHEMIDFLIFDKKKTFTIREIVNELWKFKSLPEGECDFVHKAYITREYLSNVVKAKVAIYRRSKKVQRLSKGRYLVL